jgi:REP-associated tyrosine transposase
LRNRQSHRMKGYDYSLAGAYFVTIVVAGRSCLFGELVNGNVKLSTYGKIAFEQWMRMEKRFPYCGYNPFIIMPSHVHAIISLARGAGEESRVSQLQIPPLRPYRIPLVLPNSLGAIVRAYKSSVTFRINQLPDSGDLTVWQRNYYDHIIRDEKEYKFIWNYIESNPANWLEDRFNPIIRADSRWEFTEKRRP